MIAALVVSYVCVAMLMLALWYWQKKTHRAGVVDIAWAFSTGVIAAVCVYYASGDVVRRWIVGVMVGLWALRLGWYLLGRLRREGEDGRYEMLKAQWGEKTQKYMFWFFQAQAFWAILFALPIIGAAMNPASISFPLDWIAILVYMVALIGEWVSDYQLARFRKKSEDRSQVCREGLWRYTRHPNYFFEWVYWWAYALLAIGGSWWCVSWLGVLLMYYFLTRITGIPPTEKRALQTKGDRYREYQRTTNCFFPGPVRSA